MAVYFDSGSDYVAIANNAKWTFTPVTNDGAVSCKYKTSSPPDADTEYQIIFELDENSGDKLQVGVINNGGVNVLAALLRDVGLGVDGYFYVAWAPSANTEYDLVVNFGANAACNIYINGVSQSLTYLNWVATSEINPDERVFGTDAAGVYDDTTLSHVAWWNNKLTQDEVNMLRWNPRWCLGHPDLLAYFPCDEGSGTICRDHSGSSGQTPTDGTFTGTPTWANDPPIIKMASPIITCDEITTEDFFFKKLQNVLIRM